MTDLPALGITGGLLALLLLALGSRLRISLSYHEGVFALWAHVLGFDISIWPLPTKKSGKEVFQEAKDSGKLETWRTRAEEGLARTRENVDGLSLVRDVLETLGRGLRVDWLYLDLLWAEEDPADAAIHYGFLEASVNGLFRLLEAKASVRQHRIRLGLSYARETPLITLRISASLPCYEAVRLALSITRKLIKSSNKTKKETV